MKSFLILLSISFVSYSQGLHYTPKEIKTEFVNHSVFTLGYYEKYEQSLWSYYVLRDGDANGAYPRLSRFLIDPLVSTGSAHPSDYSHSGYDRGHLVPAKDMSYSQSAIYSTFFMSNISPQHFSLNRGKWKKLENKIRILAKKKHLVHVLSGPIFKAKPKTLPNSKIKIPESFYKIVLFEDDGELLSFSFILKNKKIVNNLTNYLVSIDEIEQMTEIDFFSQLSNDEEIKIEQRVNRNEWDSFIREKKLN